jgi:hypothetical protein
MRTLKSKMEQANWRYWEWPLPPLVTSSQAVLPETKNWTPREREGKGEERREDHNLPHSLECSSKHKQRHAWKRSPLVPVQGVGKGTPDAPAPKPMLSSDSRAAMVAGVSQNSEMGVF